MVVVERPDLQRKLEEEEKHTQEKEQRNSLLRDKVTEEEIARIVERWTGIPVSRLMEGEREKLLHLEDILHERVIGQNEAVTKVTEAIIRSRAGIQDPNRPIAFQRRKNLAPDGISHAANQRQI